MIGGLIVIFGFILIVMIHEGGHLLAAKMFNIKATKYFLGFGPTIWSFTKGETEYGIKAIPAGGFVKILGMNPMEEVAEEDESRTYRASPFRQKVRTSETSVLRVSFWFNSFTTLKKFPTFF